MLLISILAFIMAIIVNVLGRYYYLFDHSHGMGDFASTEHIEQQFGLVLNLLLVAPALFTGAGYILFNKNKSHPFIPYLVTFALTFASIAIISGGSGRVEFHFSIFMVVAALGYYQDVKLLSIMTSIFAVQHIGGFLFFPEPVFGAHSYSLLMLLLHAIFLILTSSAVSWQVLSSKKIEADLRRQQQEQRRRITAELVNRLSSTSEQVLDVSQLLSKNAQLTIDASSQVAASIEQISSGTEKQLEQVEKNMKEIFDMNSEIRSITKMSEVVAQQSEESTEHASDGEQLIEQLRMQMQAINNYVDSSFAAIQSLQERSQEMEKNDQCHYKNCRSN